MPKMRLEVLVIQLNSHHTIIEHQLKLFVLFEGGRTVRVHDVVCRVESLENNLFVSK